MTLDSFGRRLRYLRLSITDVCNFRCVYCLPNGYTKCEHNFLTAKEIQNLVAAFATLGFGKVRITGGEPTTRSDLVEIASIISRTPGVGKVVLSTNGYKLKELAKPLFEAGVSALNVSLDSLDAARFKQITGKNNLHEIKDGIETAISIGFRTVKINAVLLKDTNTDDIEAFMEWTRVTPVTVRFIELMQNGTNTEFFKKHHISSNVVKDKLETGGWVVVPRTLDAGPAIEYMHPSYRGRMGVIAPYTKDFCTSCNRLRVTSTGGLRLCLFGERDYPLRHLLQSPNQHEELLERIQMLIGQKKEAHFLHDGRVGTNENFAAIGG